MERQKTIEVLNSLVTINNDRIEGYETASKSSEEQDLIALFAKFISTSQKCKQELVWEVNALGGEEAEGTKVSGKFFRAWMTVKAAITGKDRKAILVSCAFGEEQASATYNDVLVNDLAHLSAEQHNMIKGQQAVLRIDYEQIKSLHHALSDK